MKETEFIKAATLAVLPTVTQMYSDRYAKHNNSVDDQINSEEIAAIAVSIAKETANHLFPEYE